MTKKRSLARDLDDPDCLAGGALTMRQIWRPLLRRGGSWAEVAQRHSPTRRIFCIRRFADMMTHLRRCGLALGWRGGAQTAKGTSEEW